MQVQIFSKKSKKVLDIVLMLVYNKNQKGGEQMASRSKRKPRKPKPAGQPVKSELRTAVFTIITATIANLLANAIWWLILHHIGE